MQNRISIAGIPAIAAPRAAHTAAVAAMCLCLLMLGTGNADAEEQRIAGIEVKGLRAITEAEFLGRISIHKGDVFSPERVAKDLDRLTAAGIIASYAARTEAEGVVIVFTVLSEKELPEVVKVKFKGGNASDLGDICQTRKGSKLTDALLRMDSDRIRDYYIDKGYADVSVMPEVTPAGPGKVRVNYKVDKGPKFQLKKLRFVGNKAYKQKELAKAMQTKVDTWITSRVFVRRKFDEDITLLNLFYQSNGYFETVVKLKGLSTDFETGRVEAAIEVYEGPRYTIEEIKFQGNEAVGENELRDLVKVKPGAYYSYELLRKDVEAIHRHYTTGKRGYASVSVVRHDDPGKQPQTRSITYEIKEGKPTYIRRIETRGNYKTRKKVIVREMRIEPGEIYDSDKVNESERRLKDLQYFEYESIKIETSKSVPPPEVGAVEGADYTDLVVNVEEATTGSLIVGAGFNTNSNLVGRIAVEQRNFDISNLPDFSRYGIGALNPSRMFVGGGQRLRLVAEPGTERNYYYFEFEEPWFLDYPVEFYLSGYLYERSFDDYTVDRLGLTFGFARRWTREWKTSIRYRIEEVTVGGINENSPIDAVRQAGRHDFRSYRVGTDFDNRDSIIFPTKGFQAGGYGELAGPPAGGDVGLWKAGLSGGTFQKLWELPAETPNVLHLGAEANFSGPAFGDPEVPIYERFFAGGIGSFRGFSFQGIGPRQTVPPTGSTALGGQFLFIGTAEYIIPLYKEDYQMYIFNDVGTLTATTRATAFDELRDSVGLGFKFNLPIAGKIPLTLNFGVPVKKQPGDRTQFFSFALGFFF